jgi:hypothetical protein
VPTNPTVGSAYAVRGTGDKRPPTKAKRDTAVRGSPRDPRFAPATPRSTKLAEPSSLRLLIRYHPAGMRALSPAPSRTPDVHQSQIHSLFGGKGHSIRRIAATWIKVYSYTPDKVFHTPQER